MKKAMFFVTANIYDTSNTILQIRYFIYDNIVRDSVREPREDGVGDGVRRRRGTVRLPERTQGAECRGGQEGIQAGGLCRVLLP